MEELGGAVRTEMRPRSSDSACAGVKGDARSVYSSAMAEDSQLVATAALPRRPKARGRCSLSLSALDASRARGQRVERLLPAPLPANSPPGRDRLPRNAKGFKFACSAYG